MGRARVVVITGPMFSGKTRALLDDVLREEESGARVLVFKPRLDHRAATGVVRSHDGASHPAFELDTASDLPALAAGADLVAVDEIQFLGPDLGRAVAAVAEAGSRVIAAGLDRDFRGEPFENVEQAAADADEVKRLTAVCSRCGRAAGLTQRLLLDAPAPLDGPVFLVGGAETYQPRCEACFHEERKRP
jgi:thymidine kinase